MDFGDFRSNKHGDLGSAVKQTKGASRFRPNSLLPPGSNAQFTPEDMNSADAGEAIPAARAQPPSSPPPEFDSLDLSKITADDVLALAQHLLDNFDLTSESRIVAAQIEAALKEKKAFELLAQQNPDKKELQKPYHAAVFADTLLRIVAAYRPLFNLVSAPRTSSFAIGMRARQIHAEMQKKELAPLQQYRSRLLEIANEKSTFTLDARTDLKILDLEHPEKPPF